MRLRIIEVKPGMRDIEITGIITSMGDVRSVNTRFGPAQVSQAVLQDEAGSILLNLWRDQIRIAREGDRIMIENAFVRTFKDQLELNVGKDGKITVLR